MYAGTARLSYFNLSKNWKQALGRSDFKVPFCGENVGISFIVCSHHRFSELTKNLRSIWRQNDHAKFVGAFHLPKRMSDENRAYSISMVHFANSETEEAGTIKLCTVISHYITSIIKQLRFLNSHCPIVCSYCFVVCLIAKSELKRVKNFTITLKLSSNDVANV